MGFAFCLLPRALCRIASHRILLTTRPICTAELIVPRHLEHTQTSTGTGGYPFDIYFWTIAHERNHESIVDRQAGSDSCLWSPSCFFCIRPANRCSIGDRNCCHQSYSTIVNNVGIGFDLISAFGFVERYQDT